MIGHTSRQSAAKRKPILETVTSIKRSEPNRHAQYAKFLEKQYHCLKNTISDLEIELQQLDQVMEQRNDKLEHERWAAKPYMAHLSSENHLETMETQDSNFCSIAKCDDAIRLLLNNNQQVSNSIQACLMRLAEDSSVESEKLKENALNHLKDRMIESYRALLTSEIELDVQNWAIKTLEKELQKVNGLPQILPILRSSIKDCEQEVKKHRATVSHLEKTKLPSIMKDFTKQQLNTAAAEKGMDKNVYTESKQDAYDEVINILMEQAAIDQLLLYIMELEEEQLKCVTDHQEALLLDNKETIESTDTVQSPKGRNEIEGTEKAFLDSLDKMLDLKLYKDLDVFESFEAENSNASIADRLEKLESDDRAARKRTEASITAVNKLIVDSHTAVETFERHTSSYNENQNSNGHIPAGIIQSRANLETLVEDLQSEIQHYQKVFKVTTVNSELAEKKRRFALFWTNQQLFEQEFGQVRSSTHT